MVSGQAALPQRPKRQHQSLGRWFVLAALIHAELFLVLALTSYFYAPRDAELLAMRGQPNETIEFGALDAETSREILEAQEREQKEIAEAEKQKEKEEEEQPKAPGQVVDLAKPRQEKRPENARFAAEHDSSVEKETKKFGKFDQQARQGAAQGDGDVTRPASPASAPSKPTPAGEPTKSAMLAMRNPGSPGSGRGIARPAQSGEAAVPGPGSESLLAPVEDQGDLSLPGQAAPERSGGGATRESAPSPALPALVPSEQQIARAIGSGTQDHLKDIDEGDETALNAKRWKFASFFNRVKQQVREHWNPAEVYQRRDPTGAIYGSKDRYTLLRVQLKPDGSLANVALETPSGVEFLDDEAIEAFKLAQPFPNPPKQLVEESGMIHFRFGFFFELSGAPRMRVFRYNNM
jgi:TonB family protein